MIYWGRSATEGDFSLTRTLCFHIERYFQAVAVVEAANDPVEVDIDSDNPDGDASNTRTEQTIADYTIEATVMRVLVKREWYHVIETVMWERV